MSNIIDSIRLSGTTYQIQGEITVDAALDSGSTNPVENKAIYNKFDEVEQVTAAALNELNDAISGKVDASTYNTYTAATDTALNGKQPTLVSGTNIKTINNESILGSGNIDIQGGGKAIEAGRGIAITTGETADTVSFDLPISATTLGLECFNSVGNSKTGDSSTNNNIVVGSYNTIGGNGQRRQFSNNFIWGSANKIIDNNWQYDKSSTTNIICGYGNIITGESNSYTSIFGYYNNSYKWNQTLFGYYNKSINQYETSFGRYNNSVSATTTFGDSGNTLFSVGNGTSTSARHNAFEIRQNGDIYLTLDGQDVKLQDHLGGSSITVDDELSSTSENPVQNKVIYNKIDEVEQVTAAALNELDETVSGKQDELISGTNIKTINNESILGSGNIVIGGGGSITVDPSLDPTSTNPVENKAIYNKFDEVEQVTAAGLNAVNDKFDGLRLKKLTQTQYDALATKDPSTLYVIVD